MQDTKGLIESIKQHPKLNISVACNDRNDLPEDVLTKLLNPHRTTYYVFLFVANGYTKQKLDLKELTISSGELLFILPNRIYQGSLLTDETEYFKIAFDDNCLALLPQQFAFLLNPLNTDIIKFDKLSRERVKTLFQILIQLLDKKNNQQETQIILSHLNSLLTELNSTYFSAISKENISKNNLPKFIEFKFIIEKHLTDQYSVKEIASKLGMSENQLFRIVKEFSGISPKEYIIKCIMLEAQRRLFYLDQSVKELAYELGYNDPEYFSRLFKKNTGKAIMQFRKDMQDLSGS